MIWANASVVLPSWNHGVFLGEALESVYRQSLVPGRVVVVDDASTDDTPAVLSRFPAVTVLRQATRCGPGAALNRGFAAVRTPWVFVLGADDLWGADFVQAHRAAVRAVEGPVGYACAPAVYWVDGREAGSWATPDGTPCRHGAALFARAGWEACGGFPAGRFEDVGLQEALDARGYRAVPVTGTVYYYRQHELGHRNHGTENARDRAWNGCRVSGVRIPNITTAMETRLRRSA